MVKNVPAPERICLLVEDLLPLWREGLVSRETAAIIQEHLSACPHCRSLAATADRVETSLAEVPPVPTGDTETPSSMVFLRRLARRTRLYMGAAALIALAAGAVGAVTAQSGQTTPAERYQQFLRTVPGYAAAAADGSLVPLHRTVQFSGETVTIRAFYATYLGSYVVFTAEGKGGNPAVVPDLALGPASDLNAAASTPTTADGLAGYWQLANLQVPTPATDLQYNPTRVRLTVAIPSGGTRTISLVIPRSAYRPHAAISRSRTLTLSSSGVAVQFSSVEISSAGTLVRGRIRGAEASMPVLADCPAFLRGVGCIGGSASSALFHSARVHGGWTPFYWVLPAPAGPTGAAGLIAIALRGIELQQAIPVGRSLTWPMDLPATGGRYDPQSQSTSGSMIEIVHVGESTVLVTSPRPSASGMTLQVNTPGSGNPNDAPEVDLRNVTLRLPDGRVAHLTSTSTYTSGPMGHADGWQLQFPLLWQTPPTAAELAQKGMAQLTFVLDTYPMLRFPKGTLWRP